MQNFRHCSYLDKGYYWSVGIKSRFNTFERGINYDLISDDTSNPNLNRIDIEVADLTNQLYIQTVVREEFVFGVGAEHKRLRIDSETIGDDNQEETIFERSDFLSSFGFLKLDTYDNKYFPSDGLFFSGDFHWYLYSSDFNKNFEPFSLLMEISPTLPSSSGSNITVLVGVKRQPYLSTLVFSLVLGH